MGVGVLLAAANLLRILMILDSLSYWRPGRVFMLKPWLDITGRSVSWISGRFLFYLGCGHGVLHHPGDWMNVFLPDACRIGGIV